MIFNMGAYFHRINYCVMLLAVPRQLYIVHIVHIYSAGSRVLVLNTPQGRLQQRPQRMTPKKKLRILQITLWREGFSSGAINAPKRKAPAVTPGYAPEQLQMMPPKGSINEILCNFFGVKTVDPLLHSKCVKVTKFYRIPSCCSKLRLFFVNNIVSKIKG